MRVGDGLKRAVLAHEVDDAPVREGRDDGVRHGLHRHLRIERGREPLAHPGQQLEVRSASIGLGACRTLLLDEPCVVERAALELDPLGEVADDPQDQSLPARADDLGKVELHVVLGSVAREGRKPDRRSEQRALPRRGVPAEGGVVRLVQALGLDGVEVLADERARSPSKHPLDGRVGVHDARLHVGHHDRIGQCLEQRGEVEGLHVFRA